MTAALFLAACATPRALVQQLDRLTAQEKFPEAAALVESGKDRYYGKKNAFLYHLDRGALLHMAGQYAESNEAFENAKRLAQELFTKSVTTEASTFLVSDNLRPYYGEDFERALLHVFSALNYVFLGQGNEALVEARQVDFLLTKLQTDYGHRNAYTEDAFVRYLMGMLYENQGKINDAHVSYWKALEAYDDYRKNYGVSAPPDLVRDALRTAGALGLRSEIDQIHKRWGGAAPAPMPEGAGEVVVLDYNGLPPRKIDSFIEIGFFAGWPYVHAAQPRGEEQEQVEQAGDIAKSILADEMVRVAFPKYIQTPYALRSMDVRADAGTEPHPAQVAEDVGAIAVKNLQDRIGRVRAKTIARAVVKYALSRKIAAKVEEKQGAGVGWLAKKLMQVASNATELSDKRCWQTVPDTISVARVVLPAGEHDLTLTFRDGAGNIAKTQTLNKVQVAAGKKTFCFVRTAQ